MGLLTVDYSLRQPTWVTSREREGQVLFGALTARSATSRRTIALRDESQEPIRGAQKAQGPPGVPAGLWSGRSKHDDLDVELQHIETFQRSEGLHVRLVRRVGDEAKVDGAHVLERLRKSHGVNQRLRGAAPVVATVEGASLARAGDHLPYEMENSRV